MGPKKTTGDVCKVPNTGSRTHKRDLAHRHRQEVAAVWHKTLATELIPQHALGQAVLGAAELRIKTKSPWVSLSSSPESIGTASTHGTPPHRFWMRSPTPGPFSHGDCQYVRRICESRHEVQTGKHATKCRLKTLFRKTIKTRTPRLKSKR
eukprot:4475342-Amphidinium_carterae.1